MIHKKIQPKLIDIIVKKNIEENCLNSKYYMICFNFLKKYYIYLIILVLIIFFLVYRYYLKKEKELEENKLLKEYKKLKLLKKKKKMEYLIKNNLNKEPEIKEQEYNVMPFRTTNYMSVNN